MNGILTGSEYLSLPRSPETFLVEPLLPSGGALCLYGDPKVGKSFAAIQLALAIQGGKDWLGFPIRVNGNVAYIQLDTPRTVWAERLDKLRATGLQVESIHLADRESLRTWPFDIFNPEHFHTLQSELARIKPVAVIIDTLKETNQLEENSNTEGQKVIAALTAATQPAAMILVHHGRKPNAEYQEELTTGARGASYLTGRMDAIVHMSKKSMRYTGRSIEEGSLRLERQDNGLWELAMQETDAHISTVVAGGGSVREQAKRLALLINKSEESCRSLIRRRRAATGNSAVHPHEAQTTIPEPPPPLAARVSLQTPAAEEPEE